jgi:hypothetical protein
MAGRSTSNILDMIEKAPSNEDASGIVRRFADRIVTRPGIDALVAKLNERREVQRKWKALVAMVEHLRVRQVAAAKHTIEALTGLVLAAEGLVGLAKVAKSNPEVYSAAFLTALNALAGRAVTEGEDYTAKLINNRLSALQLLGLAKVTDFEVTFESLRTVVYQILEARGLKDLFERILEYPVTMAHAFDEVLSELGKIAVRDKHLSIPKITKLRISVLNGLRTILEAIVLKKEAEGGPEDAVKALTQVTDADDFLAVVARFPFVLGEDFGGILEREARNARADSDKDTALGIERRKSHLEIIGQIVGKLS